MRNSQFASSALLLPLSMMLFSCLRIFQHLSKIPQASWLWGGQGLGEASHESRHSNCLHSYTIELLSIDPLVIYVNNFLREEEIQHILSANQTEFAHSAVLEDDRNAVIDKHVRSSTSSYLARDDPVASCLSIRMKSLLGNLQHAGTEPIQIVKYEGGERFRLHVDWLHTPMVMFEGETRQQRKYNRLASVFAYLDTNCTGGETYFPEITGIASSADGTKFSKTDGDKGLIIKPRRGNAVFWTNLHLNGSGDERVAHAGLPVRSGRKIGINIWSHYFYDTAMVGQFE